MKTVRILVFILFCSLSASAQNVSTVAGQLKDAKGHDIANQPVKLVSADRSFDGKTDGDGNYRFENVPNGRYLLIAGERKLNIFVNDGRVLSSELNETVEISAGEPQPIDQVSKTVNVIDG